jgi:hypothetical protein
MVETLRGSANIPIVGWRSKTRQHKYKIGSAPWKEIHKQNIQACKKAWRFSLPADCDSPEDNLRRYDETSIIQDHLISFYDTLAMIQSDCFMSNLGGAPISLLDNEMKNLEWFHEEIRNEYEHFIPKSYSAPIKDLLESSIFALNLSGELIYESGNAYPITDGEVLRNEFANVIQTLTKLGAG